MTTVDTQYIVNNQKPNNKLYMLVALSFFGAFFFLFFLYEYALISNFHFILELASAYVLSFLLAFFLSFNKKKFWKNYERLTLIFLGLAPFVAASYFAVNFYLPVKTEVIQADVLHTEFVQPGFPAGNYIYVISSSKFLNQFPKIMRFDIEQRALIKNSSKMQVVVSEGFTGKKFVQGIEFLP